MSLSLTVNSKIYVLLLPNFQRSFGFFCRPFSIFSIGVAKLRAFLFSTKNLLSFFRFFFFHHSQNFRRTIPFFSDCKDSVSHISRQLFFVVFSLLFFTSFFADNSHFQELIPLFFLFPLSLFSRAGGKDKDVWIAAKLF
jgi:hypothetical protein